MTFVGFHLVADRSSIFLINWYLIGWFHLYFFHPSEIIPVHQGLIYTFILLSFVRNISWVVYFLMNFEYVSMTINPKIKKWRYPNIFLLQTWIFDMKYNKHEYEEYDNYYKQPTPSFRMYHLLLQCMMWLFVISYFHHTKWLRIFYIGFWKYQSFIWIYSILYSLYTCLGSMISPWKKIEICIDYRTFIIKHLYLIIYPIKLTMKLTL